MESRSDRQTDNSSHPDDLELFTLWVLDKDPEQTDVVLRRIYGRIQESIITEKKKQNLLARRLRARKHSTPRSIYYRFF
jgi:hypothetical protein